MSARFDGSSDSLVTTSNIPSDTAFTMMGWFRIENDQNAYTTLMLLGADSDGNANWCGLGSNGTQLTLYSSGGEMNGTNLAVDTWYHIAHTGNGSGANSWTAYLDGSQDIQNTTVSQNARMEWGNDSISEWFDGQMCALKVWGAALTLAEIQQEMRFVTPIRHTNLNRWVPCLDSETKDYGPLKQDLTEEGTVTLVAEWPDDLIWAPSTGRRVYAFTSGAAGQTANATAATATANAQAATVTVGAVSAAATAATATAAAQAATVQPGAVTAPATAATATASAQSATVQPGVVTVSATAATATANAQAATATVGLTASATAATATANSLAATVQPGAVTVSATAATATANSQAGLGIVDQTVVSQAATATANAQPATVQPGAVTAAVQSATATANSLAAAVLTGLSASAQTATATANALAGTVQPGAVTAAAQTATATANAIAVIIPRGLILPVTVRDVVLEPVTVRLNLTL